MRAIVNKILALIQWFWGLELQEHRHWCYAGTHAKCYHEHLAWMCKGAFCKDGEKRNCPACSSGRPCRGQIMKGGPCECSVRPEGHMLSEWNDDHGSHAPE